MPDLACGREPTQTVRVPTSFLRALTRVMLRQIRGRGSRGRRNEIAAGVARLLLRYQKSIDPSASLVIAGTVVAALNSDADDRSANSRYDFAFDPESGALCWSPPELARVLGLDPESGARRLSVWRASRSGPPWIKLGDSQQSSVIYPIAESIDWMESRRVGVHDELAQAAGGER